MPPPLLYDLARLDPDKVLYDRAFIYERLPQSHEFALLDGVLTHDRAADLCVAYHDCRADGWWTRGHIPGRPIFPGVLQLEAAAQVVAFSTRYVDGLDCFVAFGGVEDCRFREAVYPPSRIIFISKIRENRPRRVIGDVQGVVDGRMVFHARITGLAFPNENSLPRSASPRARNATGLRSPGERVR
jgi:3-hydroxyacyl-[acyl-carrier-protein] dehydratase